MLPRRCTARVATDRIEYVSIDSDLLDVLLTWDQTGTYEVGELQAGGGAGDDWMTLLLQSRAFHRIRPPTCRRSSSECSASPNPRATW